MPGHQSSVFEHGRSRDDAPPAKSFQPSMVTETRAERSHEDETDVLVAGAAAMLSRAGSSYGSGAITRSQFLSQVNKAVRVLRNRFPQDIVVDSE